MLDAWQNELVCDKLQLKLRNLQQFKLLAGFMDNEGVLQKEVIYAKLSSGKSEEVKAALFKRIDRCIAIDNENVDKRAWEINNCLHE